MHAHTHMYTHNTHIHTPRYIIFKLLKAKDKGKILNLSGEIKYVTGRGRKISSRTDFLSEITHNRRQ